jgi:hypothetical protein
LGLQLGEVGGAGLIDQPAFEGLVEPFDAPMFVKLNRPGESGDFLI